MMIKDELFKEMDALVLELLTTAADKRKEASMYSFSMDSFARRAALTDVAVTLENAARDMAYNAYMADRISYDMYQTIRNIIDFIGTDMSMEERLS